MTDRFNCSDDPFVGHSDGTATHCTKSVHLHLTLQWAAPVRLNLVNHSDM